MVQLITFFIVFFLKSTTASPYQNLDHYNNLDENEPRLLRFAERHLQNPSKERYDLVEFDKTLYSFAYRDYKKNPSFKFIYQVLQLLFENRPKGFFVEVGALDGEYLSHSLYLERSLQWEGLLVEPNAAMFKRLLKKNRKCLVSNLCVAKGSFSYEDILQTKILKRIVNSTVQIFRYGEGHLMNSTALMMEGEPGEVNYQRVKCIPLVTILKATGRKRIDVVIMSINGLEYEVMSNFPFDQISVDVWIIRNSNTHFPYPPESFDFKFIQLFASKSYAFYAIGYEEMDYVMISTKSKMYKLALKNRPENWWELVKYFTILYPPHE